MFDKSLRPDPGRRAILKAQKIMKRKLTPQRAGFGMAMRFLTPLRKIVSTTFGLRNGRKNFSRALSICLNAALRSVNGLIEVDPAKVCLSNGSLDGLRVSGIKRADGMIGISFDPDPHEKGDPDDLVMLCVYARDPGIADVNAKTFRRKDGRVELPLIRSLMTVPLLVYVYCCNRTKRSYSRSQFLGEIGKEGNDVAG